MTKSGGFFVTIINETEMQRIRASSRARSVDAPWSQWPDEMRKKSALRRLCKILPMPAAIEEMIEHDERGDDEELIERSTPTPMVRPRSAQAALEQFAGEPYTGPDTTDGPLPEPPPPQPAELPDGQPQPEQHHRAQGDSAKMATMLGVARERGRQARADGMQRRAMPPEYRDSARVREAEAWRAGFDELPLKIENADDAAAR
jgi:hypothetical protein